MTETADLCREFEGEAAPSNSIPFCQILNPPNLPLAQLKKLGESCYWGLFLPDDQARKVNFTADDSFAAVQVCFGDEGHERLVPGWLAKRIRLAIIHRSSGIDVQERTANGWRTLGPAYRGGSLTELGQMAEADKESFRFRTRYLLLLLAQNNQPLHDIPLSLGLGRGPGGSIGEEIRAFRSEVDGIYCEQAGTSGLQLSDCAHARTAIAIELGLHKGKAPFVCPRRRSKPTVDSAGVEEEVVRHERTITLVNEPTNKWLIPKESATGKLIRSLFEQYQGFGSRAAGEAGGAEGAEGAGEETLPPEAPAQSLTELDEIDF
jgi:hypothetical protein